VLVEQPTIDLEQDRWRRVAGALRDRHNVNAGIDDLVSARANIETRTGESRSAGAGVALRNADWGAMFGAFVIAAPCAMVG
jgi:hypothetical protein